MSNPYESPKAMADLLLGAKGRSIKLTIEYLTSAIEAYARAGMSDQETFWRTTKEEVENERRRREG